MTQDVLTIVKEYLSIFQEEKRQEKLLDFLKTHRKEEYFDWNNFDGHIVASGILYAKKEQEFLVLYHKDMKTYIYHGRHIDLEDASILSAAKREVIEETGIKDFKPVKIAEEEEVPFDIDTHKIAYNTRLHLKEHYHFDFRYLFTIEEIQPVSYDKHELSNFHWASWEEIEENRNFKRMLPKLKELLGKENMEEKK